jgi:prevent-host-death family protein
LQRGTGKQYSALHYFSGAAMKTLTAAEANRSFSALLRRAAAGERVVITSHGRPVAEIGPVREEAAAKDAAWQALLTHLHAQEPTIIEPWTREELYERKSWSRE